MKYVTINQQQRLTRKCDINAVWFKHITTVKELIKDITEIDKVSLTLSNYLITTT